MIKFIAGVKEKAEEVKTAFTGNLNASVTAIRDYHDQFKQAGAYLVEGFADGISENTYARKLKPEPEQWQGLRQKQQKTNWTSIHLPESDITSVISLDWDSSMPSELMQ